MVPFYLRRRASTKRLSHIAPAASSRELQAPDNGFEPFYRDHLQALGERLDPTFNPGLWHVPLYGLPRRASRKRDAWDGTAGLS
jgi:hypothetical protein